MVRDHRRRPHEPRRRSSARGSRATRRRRRQARCDRAAAARRGGGARTGARSCACRAPRGPRAAPTRWRRSALRLARGGRRRCTGDPRWRAGVHHARGAARQLPAGEDPDTRGADCGARARPRASSRGRDGPSRASGRCSRRGVVASTRRAVLRRGRAHRVPLVCGRDSARRGAHGGPAGVPCGRRRRDAGGVSRASAPGAPARGSGQRQARVAGGRGDVAEHRGRGRGSRDPRRVAGAGAATPHGGGVRQGLRGATRVGRGPRRAAPSPAAARAEGTRRRCDRRSAARRWCAASRTRGDRSPLR